MSEKIMKIEEKISKRKLKIEGYEDALREEKRLLKKEEEQLEVAKYDELLRKLKMNKISVDYILEKLDDIIIEKEIQQLEESKSTTTSNSFSSETTQY